MRKLFSVYIVALLLVLGVTTYGTDIVKADDTQPEVYFVDDAGLVSSDERQEIEDKLAEIRDTYKFDVVIYTTNDSSLTDAQSAADDFYDYNGYGAGSDDSGVLLYVNMSTRDWHISTCGYGITAFTDAGIEYIGDNIKSDLSDGDYYYAFDSFADYSEDFVKQAKEGKPYDVSNMPKEPFPFLGNLIISLGIGIVVAAVYALILRGQLKSVAPKDSAADYVKNGSVHVNDGGSIYLYSRVSKTERQTESSSSGGGGSSTHTSSSGSTHGGGGGKF